MAEAGLDRRSGGEPVSEAGAVPAKRVWLGIALAAICAGLALFFYFHPGGKARILLAQDAYDPLAGLIEPYGGGSIEPLNPYQLGLRLPGLKGMAFVFGTQARHYQGQAESSGYVPLYTATLVIAVNRNGNSAGLISGWRTLLESEAVVLPPHHGTEGGRLAAIALARGLGAEEGDLSPAIRAYASLQAQNRLNHQDQYHSRAYWAMFDPEGLEEHDAVILWDYQAAVLKRSCADWEIVYPEEGPFSVDCGFAYGGDGRESDNLRAVKGYLLSDEGRQALEEAGFSPLTGPVDLSVWDRARLAYNPGFRRTVLNVKRYGPASVQERLLLQAAILFLFAIAVQRILRRIPAGLYRATSLAGILFVLLWMVLGTAKLLVPTPALTRYLWFATYIPRHFLPVCWFCMCHVNRYSRLPSQRNLAALLYGALFLTAFVFTNDLHRFFFAYTGELPVTWTDQYTNGWGYYLSLSWAFSLSVAGLMLLVYNNWTGQEKRRMFYAAIFFILLTAYQSLYAVGVEQILDLDIPTTVALLFLVFILAAQRERFMGASLLELPLFQNSPYAISIYSREGRAVYNNALMDALPCGGTPFPLAAGKPRGSSSVPVGGRVFRPHVYELESGRALVLEDVTPLKRLEGQLQETHKRLKAIRGLLIRRAGETRRLAGRLERERHARQMEGLFQKKLEEARRYLGLLSKTAEPDEYNGLLRRIRFLLSICQQRLRLIISSLENHASLPFALIERYAAGMIEAGRRFGLDAVITADLNGTCPPVIVAPLLESIDRIFLYSFGMPGSSVICRLERGASALIFTAHFSQEGDLPFPADNLIPEDLQGLLTGLGGEIHEEAEEDGLLVRLIFPCREVAK